MSINPINSNLPPPANEGKQPEKPNEGKQQEVAQPTNAAYQQYWKSPVQTMVETGTNGPVVVMRPAQGPKRVPVGRGHTQQ